MAIEQLISCFESRDDAAIGRLGLLPLFVIEFYSMGLGPLSSMENDPEFSLATQRKMTDLEADRLRKALMDYIESANPAHKGMAIGHLARFRDEKLKPFFIHHLREAFEKHEREYDIICRSQVFLAMFGEPVITGKSWGADDIQKNMKDVKTYLESLP